MILNGNMNNAADTSQCHGKLGVESGFFGRRNGMKEQVSSVSGNSWTAERSAYRKRIRRGYGTMKRTTWQVHIC